ncbi:unnamed protein product [Pararhodospirillum photometricum DSM 122]|uniref:Uncharacterized protein n=1 Tax=Pararhodospirillum photometricum DSM 122 TaxID=1150469 RepID=H6SSN0_PARPM|nr:unnamed protein product [Pararhodospirillum photometricum DSM 122]CCG08270.1 unnamed protein product [Pararhodospirillum photometricum DSM 122]
MFTTLVFGEPLFFPDPISGEPCAALGVDVQAVGGTPIGEGLGVDVSALHDYPALAHELLALFGAV